MTAHNPWAWDANTNPSRWNILLVLPVLIRNSTIAGGDHGVVSDLSQAVEDPWLKPKTSTQNGSQKDSV